VLVALFGAGWGLSAAAKPPDLPVKDQVVCDPPAGPGQAQAAPEEDDLHARARQDTGRRTLRRCVLFAAHPLLALLPLDDWFEQDEDSPPLGVAVYPDGSRVRVRFDDGFRVGVDFSAAERAKGTSTLPSPASGEQQEPPAAEPSTCPYLREKAAREQAGTPSAPEAPGSVIDNLEKLEQASRVYRRGEAYRRRGQVREARGCYEKVRELCPGSRFARLAGERLEHLRAAEIKHADEATGEEEDAPPPTPGEMKGEKHSLLRTTESRVATLLERCQRAFAAERYDEAERLARRAIALNPAAVAAHPLVYKLQLLAQLREKIARLPRHPVPLFADDSGGPGSYDPEHVLELMHRYYDFFKRDLYAEAELCALQALALDPSNPTVLAAARLAAMQRLIRPPASDPAPCPWAAEPRTTMRQPDLPPVDPKVVGAMEQILTDVGEPNAEKVTVTVDEQGAAEEQDEPPATSDEVPTLLIGPPGDDPAEHAARNLPLPDLLEILRPGACVEVEGAPFCGRGQCQVALGMVSARVAWDWRGEHGSFMLSLVVGETTDLGADQWEQNDEVADWIATHGAAEKKNR
jgi:tetratricopeptide (TPR) repeat protein